MKRPALVASLALAVVVGGTCFDYELSLHGDNAEFIVLARSIAAGEGLTYTHLPEPVPSVKYPPVFPTMLAPLSSSVLGMKKLVLASYWATVTLATAIGGFSAGVYTALNPHIVLFSSQIMSELPFTALTLAAILTLPGSLALGLAFAAAAYFTRSAGLVLLIAIVSHSHGRRRWVALAVTGACVAGWSLRNYLVADSGGFYFVQLLQGNPYYPEMGWTTPAALTARIGQGLLLYWPAIALAPLIRDRLQLTYVLGSIAMAVLWPFHDWRFLVPIMPVLAIGLADRLRQLLRRYWIMGSFAHAVVACLMLAHLELPRSLPRVWQTYQDAGDFIREKLPADAVIACRKAFLMHVVSDRTTTTYKFDKPDRLIADLYDQGVTHVVVDELPFRHTSLHLVPAVSNNPELFDAVWGRDHTWVLELKP